MDNTIPLRVLNFNLIQTYQSPLGSRVRDTCWGLRPAASEKTWEGEGLGLRSTWGCLGERLASLLRCAWALLCARACVNTHAHMRAYNHAQTCTHGVWVKGWSLLPP